MDESGASATFITMEIISRPPTPGQSSNTDQQTIDGRSNSPTPEIEVGISQPLRYLSENRLGLVKTSGPSTFTFWSKLGWLSSIILIAGTISIIGSMCFLSFLSYGDSTYGTWRNIALRNWFTRCLALSSILMRTTASMQGGVATSMLAGLALESMEVPLMQTASISSMRNVNTGPLMFTFLMWEALRKVCRCWRHVFIPVLALLFTITTLLIQFTSTALLSDLGFGLISGENTQYSVATNFEYDNTKGTIPILPRDTTWKHKPPYYPVFAEYHEDIGGDETEDGISDTGLTLRAFMPFQEQQSRYFLKSYSGRATVLDGRVTCMRPNLTAANVHIALGHSLLALTGAVKATFNTSRLVLEHTSEDYYNGTPTWANRVESYFTCLGDIGRSDDSTPAWPLSICQPETYNGQLASEFATTEEVSSYIAPEYRGTTYLIMNITSVPSGNWNPVNNSEDATSGDVVGLGNRPDEYINQKEWLDLIIKPKVNPNEPPKPDLRLSVTLCYTAFDTAELNIEATSSGNRTEPAPVYDSERNTYNYSDIRRQFGQPPGGSPLYSEPATSRGTMQLRQRNSWLPGDGDYYGPSWIRDNSTPYYRGPGQPSFILDFANMAGSVGPNNIPSGANFTSFLYSATRPEEIWSNMQSIHADPLHIFLLQDILQHGGTIAFALQSLITSLSSTAYYDQLKQFNSVNDIMQTNFVIATIPNTHHGFLFVVVIYASHLALLSIFSSLFIAKTTVSTVGNAWQTIAQLKGEDVDDLLARSSEVTDSRVKKIVKASGLERTFVRLRRTNDGDRIEIVRVT